jgi:hypothetical protein
MFCAYSTMCHIMVLLRDCSMIEDESIKKSNDFCLINVFLIKGKVIGTKLVLWRSRSKIHRYVAAPKLEGVFVRVEVMASTRTFQQQSIFRSSVTHSFIIELKEKFSFKIS